MYLTHEIIFNIFRSYYVTQQGTNAHVYSLYLFFTFEFKVFAADRTDMHRNANAGIRTICLYNLHDIEIYTKTIEDNDS